MPPAELKEWMPLIKDALLGIAALVTTVIAIYGARMWKRELAGKEIYAATKNLVKESHLLFSQLITEVIHRIGNYIAIIQDYSKTVLPDSLEVQEVQEKLYPSDNIDDELSQKIANAREEGEKCMLAFLHRPSIRG